MNVNDSSAMKKIVAALDEREGDGLSVVYLSREELVEIRTGLNSAHRWCDRATVLEEAAERVGILFGTYEEDPEVDYMVALEKACRKLRDVLRERAGVTTALVAMHRIRDKVDTDFRVANSNISREEEEKEKFRQSGHASAFLSVVQRIDRIIGRLEQEEGRPWDGVW
jgi:hypothetical protein